MPIPLDLVQLFSNNAVSLLAESITSTDTSLTVMPGKGSLYPSPNAGEFFLITLENEAGTEREIIKVTGRVGDVFTFTLQDRGQEGTIARTWLATFGNDTLVDHRVTAETLARATKLPVAISGGGSTWINGANTLGTIINAFETTSISATVYANNNRAFRFLVSVLHASTYEAKAFEILLIISGDLGANTEVPYITLHWTGSPSVFGEIQAVLNTSTKILTLQWASNVNAQVTVNVTRIQHQHTSNAWEPLPPGSGLTFLGEVADQAEMDLITSPNAGDFVFRADTRTFWYFT